MRRLSDRVCLENDLSVITNPKLHSKGRFLHYGAWLGRERQPSYKERLRASICDALAKGPDSFDAFLRLMEESGYAVKRGRGGAISFLVPGQQRATRLRSSTLGEGFDPDVYKRQVLRAIAYGISHRLADRLVKRASDRGDHGQPHGAF